MSMVAACGFSSPAMSCNKNEHRAQDGTASVMFNSLQGHLDAEDVGASLVQLLGQVQVVLQRVLVSTGVGHVARVRNGRLDNTSRVTDRLHAHGEVGHVVERVEHAEDVHARLLGELAKPANTRYNVRLIC